MVYFSLLIPVIAVIILFVFFRRNVVWWEAASLLGITVLFILIAKWISVSSLTDDTEYLGGYVTGVEYYQAWDEEVPCRHPVYCTDPCCSKDKEGNCESCQVQCGWEHDYDVDFHPEHWDCITTLRNYGITQQRYNELVAQFGGRKVFVDLHRDYHSIDGDEFLTEWLGEDKTLEPVAVTHTYENRPQAAKSLFHYDDVDTSDIKLYHPFTYPQIYNQFHQQVLLGYNDPNSEQLLQVVNSRLGHSHQVRVFFLIFVNQPREAAYIQEQYWQGGNKNELVVCIGIDSNKKVKWGHIISWTDAMAVKVKVKHRIDEEETLDLPYMIKYVEAEIKSEWIRKPFHDFDYINIEPSATQTLWIFILTILVDVGLAVWVVKNEIDVEEDDRNFRRKKW